MNAQARVLSGFLAVLALVLGGALMASRLLAPNVEGDPGIAVATVSHDYDNASDVVAATLRVASTSTTPALQLRAAAMGTRPPDASVPRSSKSSILDFLAAKATEGTAAKVGGAGITSVEDVLTNPSVLAGKTPSEVEAALGESPGWKVETLGRGSRKGQGWVLREYDDAGNPTGRLIRWHPGGGHHGPDPYWRLSSLQGGNSGPIR